MIRAALMLLLALTPLPALAQAVATLVADEVVIEADSRLVASGNVQAFHDGTTLSASRIVYDRGADRLTIVGPIFLTGPGGEIITAEAATLDPRLENGILRGARLVLERQLQLAAVQIDRVDGRYSQLYKTAATSCAVCDGRPPLWEIRAERVIHDEEAQQLYFRNAQFRVRGVPILWLPRMRLPDPSLDRATGFLIPRIRSTNLLGSGLKLPYFIVLGPSRDLTLTPYLANSTTTLEARYRQKFLAGEITLNMAASRDTLPPDGLRGYIFADGSFALGGGYRLGFDIEATTDDAYLFDYGYADTDRLDSAITLTRVTPDEAVEARLTYYQTLRADEQNRTLPPITASLRWRRDWALAGGRLALDAGGDALVRYGEGVGEDGRDVTRIGAAVDWQRDWITPQGLAVTGTLGARADYYMVSDAVSFAPDLVRTVPHARLTFRLPLEKTTNRARHLLEPVLALAWSEAIGDLPPNEDSTRAELDPGNLFALTRHPGEDARETGLRAAAGLAWHRQGRDGTLTRLSFGRVWQDEVDPAFTVASGLDSRWSDWLVAGTLDLPRGLRLDARALLRNDLDPTLAEARIDWQTAALDLHAAYIWQAPDAQVGRPDTVSEWSLDGEVQLNDAWAVSFDTRYDIVADRPARAGIGAQWRNECVTVDLSVSRRYTSSDNVEPSTDYGLSVELSGFSAGRSAARPAPRCR